MPADVPVSARPSRPHPHTSPSHSSASAAGPLAAVALLAVAILFAGCRSTQPAGNGLSAPEAERLRSQVDSLRQAADSLQQSARLRHPGLNGTLWQQTAVEYAGTTRGAYQLAAVMAERALDDSTWTAAIEQSEMGAEAYRSLPPAVVLDVDETVLDNSAYQARLVRTNTDYAPSSWKAWCREEAAGAVPGALAFTRTMAEQGVQVIYLTNRDGDVESATRDNLRQLGFPIRETKIDDAVLTQGEREGWEPKTARRAWVAEQFRILLLIGDNFGDFADEVETSLAERKRKADAFEKYWGTRWIVLPNTQYGSWEGALFNYDYSLPALDVLKQKHQRLETKD